MNEDEASTPTPQPSDDPDRQLFPKLKYIPPMP